MPSCKPCNSIWRIGALGLLLAAVDVGAQERIELENIQIHGVQEQPRVIYIVPWRDVQPDTSPLPLRSMIDEELAPIDIDAFRRQVRYHYSIADQAIPDR